jgi:hypothetical protein
MTRPPRCAALVPRAYVCAIEDRVVTTDDLVNVRNALTPRNAELPNR